MASPGEHYEQQDTLSVVEWRRQQRLTWQLPDNTDGGLNYDAKSIYAQPQKQDWPVYDPELKQYVEWTPERSHLDSMLCLSDEQCKQLRHIKIFQRIQQEHGQQRRGATYNWKKMGMSRGEWR